MAGQSTSQREKNKTKFRQKTKRKQSKPVLSDPDVKKHLKELHEKLVIVTIDKASNSFALICRQYYILLLLADVHSQT